MILYPSVAVANQALAEAQARAVGHEYKVVCTWMIEDDADFHAVCKCSWRSRDVRAGGHAHRLGREHLRVAKQMEARE